jgi:esterase/lipase superfamily enzyme
MRRDKLSLYSPAIGADGAVIAYGHNGRPLLVFPSQQGHSTDYEDRGMISSISGLIEAGRVKVYCVDSFDTGSWDVPGNATFEERAQLHGRYEDWILGQVVPFIFDDCDGPTEIITTGCSFGAYHASNFALKRADLFPLALCHSGIYDLDFLGHGDSGDAVYFNNPAAYVQHMGGDHLEWLRDRVNLVLVCGQGMWEDTTGSLESTKAFAGILADKGIRHELDLWGHDVPHDWPSWRNQIAHHLPRFV